MEVENQEEPKETDLEVQNQEEPKESQDTSIKKKMISFKQSNVRKNKYLLDFELPDDFEDFDTLSDDLVQKGILENHHEIIEHESGTY